LQQFIVLEDSGRNRRSRRNSDEWKCGIEGCIQYWEEGRKDGWVV